MSGGGRAALAAMRKSRSPHRAQPLLQRQGHGAPAPRPPLLAQHTQLCTRLWSQPHPSPHVPCWLQPDPAPTTWPRGLRTVGAQSADGKEGPSLSAPPRWACVAQSLGVLLPRPSPPWAGQATAAPAASGPAPGGRGSARPQKVRRPSPRAPGASCLCGARPAHTPHGAVPPPQPGLDRVPLPKSGDLAEHKGAGGAPRPCWSAGSGHRGGSRRALAFVQLPGAGARALHQGTG